MDKDGLITIQSRYTPKETMQRLETAVKSKGMRSSPISTMPPAQPRLV
jgi:hypothetical protein